MIFLISCSGIEVRRDYDIQADFSRLQAYNWLPMPDNTEIKPLTVKRLQNAVNTQLKEKGLTLTSDNPDFLIEMLVSTRKKVDPNVLSRGHRDLRRVYYYEEGTLILDFVDAQSNELVWRGVARGILEDKPTPEKQEEKINTAVEKMLKDYPPSK